MSDNQPYVDNIWSTLIASKRGDCEINESDEKMLRADISNKLDAHWTTGEVTRYLRYTEYFDNVSDEDYCLKRMREIAESVKERLGK